MKQAPSPGLRVVCRTGTGVPLAQARRDMEMHHQVTSAAVVQYQQHDPEVNRGAMPKLSDPRTRSNRKSGCVVS